MDRADPLGLGDLHRQVKLVGNTIRDRPKWGVDAHFVAWFLRARVCQDEKEATDSLTGQTRDATADAIHYSPTRKRITIVQGKYRKRIGARSEKVSDVVEFAGLAAALLGPQAAFEEFCTSRRPAGLPRERLEQAREYLQGDDKWRLSLAYVTTGRVRPVLRARGKALIRAWKRASIEFVAGREVLDVLEDYLAGVGPTVPEVKIWLRTSIPNFTLPPPYRRRDKRHGIDAWLFTTTGDVMGDLYREWRDALFSRNVRGYKGESEVNSKIGGTIRQQPQNFFYYNNGITIVCDFAEPELGSGEDFLLVRNPQIINGQQTTRQLALRQNRARASNVDVMVRVIKIPRRDQKSASGFDRLVKEIVRGSNWQNRMTNVDLKANEARQVELERALRPIGYYYVRKSMARDEVARLGGAGRIEIDNVDVAYAVAATDFDPALPVKPGEGGKESLFSDQWYPKIFRERRPAPYVMRWWLLEAVRHAAGRRKKGRTHAKWLALNFAWRRMHRSFRSDDAIQQFVETIGTKSYKKRLREVLTTACRPVVDEAMRFYEKNKTAQGEEVEASAFFKRSDVGRVTMPRAFVQFWNRRGNRSRRKLDARWATFLRRYRAAAATRLGA